jgi:hypothetical protein
MKRWHQKALVQKTVSFLPYPHQINFLFQKFITKGINLTDRYLTYRLTHASQHIGAFERHAPGRAIDASLELGTGWYPIIPVCLFLYGAKEVHTVDILEHCSRGRILATLKMLRDYHKSGRLASFISVRADRWEALLHLLDHAAHLTKEELFKNLHINYHICDARRLALPDGSISLITSNNTLEHVSADVLHELLAEFRRLCAAGGVMSHFIDMSDHFAHLDPSITVYNYLRYSRRQWRWIDNAIQPQNRLRMSHYRALYAGLGIPITEERCREGSVDALSEVDVHPDFAGIPLAELAISRCLLVSKM